MCLAIPMKLLNKNGERATVEIGGTQREVMLTLTPEAGIGDWVIVHAGFALEILDEAEAQRTLDLLRDVRRDAS